jgi:hypothetical protein
MRTCFVLLLFGAMCSAGSPEIAGCPVFTTHNIWNTQVDKLSVAPASAAYITTIGANAPVHPDFSSNPIIGIPFNVIQNDKGVTKAAVQFQFKDESDRTLYPLPAKAAVEAGTDNHLIVINKSTCVLYELFGYAQPSGPGQPYSAGSGAVWNLNWDELRPADWTSADAAGLPIFPGLVRYDEIASGSINHALRFTAPQTQADYAWPARHLASKLSGAQFPLMGSRFRLKADVDISKYSETNKIILRALKKYGMMLADNGSAWYITGAPDPRWLDSDLAQLAGIKGSDFEVVDVTPLIAAHDSGEVLSPLTTAAARE